MLFALVSSSLWIVTSIYSIGYMRGLNEHSQTRYFVFFALALSATIGVAFSANLLTMYLFYEMLSLATYPWSRTIRTARRAPRAANTCCTSWARPSAWPCRPCW